MNDMTSSNRAGLNWDQISGQDSNL